MIREDIFKFFANYIHKYSGITYHDDNAHGLESRLNNLSKMMGLNDVEELYKQFQRNITHDMHEMVIDLATNNETCFFRDRKPFKAMTESIIPEIMAVTDNCKSIHIWSAACSTGQEPYSILMTLAELSALSTWTVNVHAADISPRVLEQAESGIYSQLQIQRGVPIIALQKYFKPYENDSWIINPELRAKIKFFRFNLLNGSYPIQQYHIVFCRNVLIYQDMNNKKRISEKLYGALVPGGTLFLGTGESMLKINDQFIQKTTPHCTVFQKPNPFANKELEKK